MIGTSTVLDRFPALVRGPSGAWDGVRVLIHEGRMIVFGQAARQPRVVVDETVASADLGVRNGSAWQVTTTDGAGWQIVAQGGCGCHNVLKSYSASALWAMAEGS